MPGKQGARKARSKSATIECPACGLTVRVRKDGTPYRHRVGGDQDAPYCTGIASEPEPVAADEVTEDTTGEQPEAPAPEPQKLRIAKPIPALSVIPAILGTDVLPLSSLHGLPYVKDGPAGALDHLELDDDQRSTLEDLRGALHDLWSMCGRRRMRIAVKDGGRVAVGYEDGIGSWLDGPDGSFAKIPKMGGKPFGLAVLVRPAKGEPWVMYRRWYEHEGEMILGEVWVANQDRKTGRWSTHRQGNARSNSVRWYVEV